MVLAAIPFYLPGRIPGVVCAGNIRRVGRDGSQYPGIWQKARTIRWNEGLGFISLNTRQWLCDDRTL
jgi:hypothetical protein